MASPKISQDAAEVAASLTRIVIHTMSTDPGYRKEKLERTEKALQEDDHYINDFYWWLDGQYRRHWLALLLAVPAGPIYNELVSAHAAFTEGYQDHMARPS